MKKRVCGGMLFGVMMGAALSIFAEENFRVDRSIRAMNRAGRNISRRVNKIYMSVKHML